MKNLYLTILTTVISLFCYTSSIGQSTFQKIYTSTDEDFPLKVISTQNGEFLLSGFSKTFSGNEDAILIRIDSLGNIIWSKHYGNTGIEHAQAVIELPNEDILLCGHTTSPNGDEDVWAMKTDAAGSVIWTKVYQASGDERARSIVLDGNGGYYLLGRSTSLGLGDFDVLLMHINGSGNLLWNKAYEGGGKEEGRALKIAADGNLVFVGWSDSFSSKKDVLLAKTDTLGNMLWSTAIGKNNAERGVDLTIADNGDIIVVGFSKVLGNSDRLPIILRTDSVGGILWWNSYSSGNWGMFKNITKTSTTDLIVTGISDIPNRKDTATIKLVKINAQGIPLWSRHVGTPTTDDDYPNILQNDDGGITIFGHTNNFRLDTLHDLFLTKTDSMGVNSCNNVSISDTANPDTPAPYTTTWQVNSGLIESTYSFASGNAPYGIDTLCENIIISVLSHNDDHQVLVYPNPTSAIVNVLIPESLSQNKLLLELFDYSGKLIRTSTNKKIDLSNIPQGIYLLKIKSENELFTRKIIKRN